MTKKSRIQINLRLDPELEARLDAEMTRQPFGTKLAPILRGLLWQWIWDQETARKAGDPRLNPPAEPKPAPKPRKDTRPRPMSRGKRKKGARADGNGKGEG